MHEDVFAFISSDEAIAFGVVKPLYYTVLQLLHPPSPFLRNCEPILPGIYFPAKGSLQLTLSKRRPRPNNDITISAV